MFKIGVVPEMELMVKLVQYGCVLIRLQVNPQLFDGAHMSAWKGFAAKLAVTY